MLVKVFVLVAALAAVAMSAATPKKLLVGEVNVQQEWTNWKTVHSKKYESPTEEKKRFKIFEENVKEVLDHNAKFQAGEESYTKGLNQFSDQTDEEFTKHHTGLLIPPSGTDSGTD